MAFTLQNHPMMALSQAGANFGSGLGQQVNQAMQNRKYASALEGQNPTDLLGILQSFARNNVSPQLQEMFFNPAIQSRLQAQEANRIIEEGFRNAKTPQDAISAVLRAQAVTGQIGNIGPLLDVILGRFYTDNQPNQPMGESAPPAEGNKPASGGQRGLPPNLPGVEAAQMVQFPGVAQTGLRSAPLETIPAATITKPYTEKEANALRQDLRRRLGLSYGDREADRLINQRKQQYDIEQNERKMSIEERQLQRETENEIKEYINNQYQKDFGDNPYMDPEFNRMANDLATYEKGTKEQRYQKIKQDYLNPIEATLRSINKNLTGVPMFEGLEGPQKQAFLQNLNPTIQKYLELFPAEYQQLAHEKIRTQLRAQNGIGPVSAEYAIKMPNESTVKEFKSLGSPGKSWQLQGRYGQVPNREYEKKLKIAEKKLPGMIKKALENNESPLVLKDLVVNGLGYPDEIFNNAMAKARADGATIAPYYQQSYNDTFKRFGPSLYDLVRGRTLLGPTEFYR